MTLRAITTVVAALVTATLLATCGEDGIKPEPTKPKTVTISPASVSLQSLDDTVQLTATVKNQHGQTMSDVATTWTSSDPATATVDAAGLVTAVANGTADVTATAGSVSGVAKMTVAQVPAEISVDPDSLVFTQIGDTARVAAAFADANGHAVADAEVEWTSGDPSVATVDDWGLVTAVANGPTIVTATAGSASGSAKVTVGWPDSVAITIRDDTIGTGETVRLAATAFDEDGLSMGDSKFLWTSSDTSVARVDGSGLVTGRADGRAIVTAALGPARGTAEIRVWSSDRFALVALYNATDGPNWRNSDNWLTDAPVERWQGVSADESGRVVRLSLPYRGLSGALPSELGDLVRLEELNLAENNLTGAIPAEIGNLSNLRILHLWQNHLTDSIPSELGRLIRLTELVLSTNDLTGPIPPELGNLRYLRELYLNSNELTGEIPPELGRLGVLQTLYLYNNDLTGTIPPELGRLDSLEWMDLGYNRLTGEIPPELGDLPSLIFLFLNSNELTGAIPPELGDLRVLQRLYLDYNELTGEIPPELGDMPWLIYLNLNDNELTGEIPPELGDLPGLAILYLNDNELTGAIPPELGGLSRLGRLMLGGNRLSGGIPPELGDLGTLERFVVDRNELTGPVPPELGNLEALEILALSENPLSGPLPLSMTGLTALSSLWFHDTKLCVQENADFKSWLAGLDSVTTSGLTCDSEDRAPRIVGAMAGQGPLEGMTTDPGGFSLLFDARIRLPVRVNGVTVYERGGGAGRGAFDLLGQTEALRVPYGGGGRDVGMMPGPIIRGTLAAVARRR